MDMVYGGKYGIFLMEELFQIVWFLFLLLDVCEENYVVGLLMGGYGVFKWVLSKFDMFVVVVGFLMGNFLFWSVGLDGEFFLFLCFVFGDGLYVGMDNDFYYLIQFNDCIIGLKFVFY